MIAKLKRKSKNYLNYQIVKSSKSNPNEKDDTYGMPIIGSLLFHKEKFKDLTEEIEITVNIKSNKKKKQKKLCSNCKLLGTKKCPSYDDWKEEEWDTNDESEVCDSWKKVKK